MDRGSDSPPTKTSSLKVIELSDVILRITLNFSVDVKEGCRRAQVLCGVRLQFITPGGRRKIIERRTAGIWIILIILYIPGHEELANR
jgi:hypothetical protein